MSLDWIFGIVILLFLFGIIFLFLVRRRPKLSEADFRKFTEKIKATKKLDPNHALMECHKLFVAAIGTLYPDKNLTAAQKIAQIKSRLPNESKIWQFHGLRNKVAHEPEANISESQVSLAREAFVRALESLMK